MTTNKRRSAFGHIGLNLVLTFMVVCASTFLNAQAKVPPANRKPVAAAPAVMPTTNLTGISLGPVGFAATGNGIEYHGGPVMLSSHNVYFIWYGNWSGNTATTILPAA